MTPREFRQEQEFEFDHFQELTSTGIKPNYVNIELFADEYHKAKLKLLGIGGVVSTLNHEDLAVGEQVRITQIKLVEINCFREDGDIDVEDATSVFTVGIDEIQKVV